MEDLLSNIIKMFSCQQPHYPKYLHHYGIRLNHWEHSRVRNEGIIPLFVFHVKSLPSFQALLTSTLALFSDPRNFILVQQINRREFR